MRFSRLLTGLARRATLAFVRVAFAGWLGTVVVLGFVASLPRPAPFGSRDLDVFLASGRAAVSGANPYSLVLRPGPDVNLNPPVSLLVFGPLARLPADAVLPLCYAASVLLAAWTYWRLIRAYAPLASPFQYVWPLALAGVWLSLYNGQVYVGMEALGVCAYLALGQGRNRTAGLAIGALTALKPNFALWPLLLLAGGEAPVALVAFATAAALSLVPLAIWGPAIYWEWLLGAGTVARGLVVEPGNLSLFGMAAALRQASASSPGAHGPGPGR